MNERISDEGKAQTHLFQFSFVSFHVPPSSLSRSLSLRHCVCLSVCLSLRFRTPLLSVSLSPRNVNDSPNRAEEPSNHINSPPFRNLSAHSSYLIAPHSVFHFTSRPFRLPIRVWEEGFLEEPCCHALVRHLPSISSKSWRFVFVAPFLVEIGSSLPEALASIFTFLQYPFRLQGFGPSNFGIGGELGLSDV